MKETITDALAHSADYEAIAKAWDISVDEVKEVSARIDSTLLDDDVTDEEHLDNCAKIDDEYGYADTSDL